MYGLKLVIIIVGTRLLITLQNIPRSQFYNRTQNRALRLVKTSASSEKWRLCWSSWTGGNSSATRTIPLHAIGHQTHIYPKYIHIHANNTQKIPKASAPTTPTPPSLATGLGTAAHQQPIHRAPSIPNSIPEAHHCCCCNARPWEAMRSQ
jgi:hypothetical protein